MSEINTRTITALNHMLSQEYACAIRYATHASVVSGPYAEAVAARLNEISTDELNHASILRDRINALGGKPTMELSTKDLIFADDLDEILKINIAEEKDAIKSYLAIFSDTSPTNVILYQALQDIIRDEQEHLEELENLQEARR